MPHIHALDYVELSEVGLVRPANQDACLVSDEYGLVIVADGMGGHNGGEVASQLAISQISKELACPECRKASDRMQTLIRLGQAVEHANRHIWEAVDDRPELVGMGTTVVCAMFRMGRIFFAHVGDSRLYRLRNGQLLQLTRDHSLVQQLIDRGVYHSVAAANAAGIGNNVLTRGLGIEQHVDVDLGEEELAPGDVFLFCSDGLSGMINDQQIAACLREYDDLEMAAERLMLGALSAGGRDNVTLVLARPRFEGS